MSYVTNTHLEKFTEKLLTNDKNIRDELKREISKLPSGGGSTGRDGKSLEFNWQGTSLGIRKEGESMYSYTDLKGNKGDKGDPGLQGPKGDQGNDGFTPIITFNNEKTEMTVSGKTTTNKVDFKKITENVVAQAINNSLVTVNVLTQEEYDALGSYENAFYFIKG